MESLYLLIPISLGLLVLIVWFLNWSIKSGQFDDLDGPGEAILMDDDAPNLDKVSEHFNK
ncbi:cbb3-type cytochrome oxidase assembly protein CcoS [Polynucleobacter tropicus]|uniref:Cbb3-type cytochrome oxidase assembly protein CcoS n=1 Tax=Polynucleobacter tropicus TaxID=1743174 RepID=A0A6M9Q220_9BURK|nr:cbb3-type cytochrome oxidase assembly protein CcoS [Polynucleobacter tropicus]QKM65165.1 cbb3-type cytochrome oxidase assembly protein CcoS [Polynucleobacter tropicus]